MSLARRSASIALLALALAACDNAGPEHFVTASAPRSDVEYQLPLATNSQFGDPVHNSERSFMHPHGGLINPQWLYPGGNDEQAEDSTITSPDHGVPYSDLPAAYECGFGPSVRNLLRYRLLCLAQQMAFEIMGQPGSNNTATITSGGTVWDRALITPADNDEIGYRVTVTPIGVRPSALDAELDFDMDPEDKLCGGKEAGMDVWREGGGASGASLGAAPVIFNNDDPNCNGGISPLPAETANGTFDPSALAQGERVKFAIWQQIGELDFIGGRGRNDFASTIATFETTLQVFRSGGAITPTVARLGINGNTIRISNPFDTITGVWVRVPGSSVYTRVFNGSSVGTWDWNYPSFPRLCGDYYFVVQGSQSVEGYGIGTASITVTGSPNTCNQIL